MGAKLRPGNAHSADGVLGPVSPLVDRYRSWFKQFWLRGDAAFASPDLYEFCENRRINYFIRISSESSLKSRIRPHLKRPAGRPPKTGVQVRVIEFQYRAESWDKPRRVVCKIEWHMGELFPRIGFIVTNSYFEAHKVITIYNGRAEIENRIKEGKNTLRWDKTSRHRFAANQARLLVGCLAYNLLHMIRNNTAIGEFALCSTGAGNYNTALGFHAGMLAGSPQDTFAGSNNIYIGHDVFPVTLDECNTIRTGNDESGSVAYQTFIAGISTSTVTGSAVYVDPNTGQLGILTSSRQYKEDIEDIRRHKRRPYEAPACHFPLQARLRQRTAHNAVRPDRRRGR